MWDIAYKVLIVIAILLYLWQDGIKLMADIGGSLVFTTLSLCMIVLVIFCVLYIAGLIVISPVLRLVFRLDTSNYMQVGMKWLMRPISLLREDKNA